MELLAITVYLQLQSVQHRRVVTTVGVRFQRLLIFIEKVIKYYLKVISACREPEELVTLSSHCG
jgi:hypothetical protein